MKRLLFVIYVYHICNSNRVCLRPWCQTQLVVECVVSIPYSVNKYFLLKKCLHTKICNITCYINCFYGVIFYLFMTSGAFKSLWMEQDGVYLHLINYTIFFFFTLYFYKMKNKECTSSVFCFLWFMKIFCQLDRGIASIDSTMLLLTDMPPILGKSQVSHS